MGFTLTQQARNIITMCYIKNIGLRQDEDHLAIKKKKARIPKPRDKWSLLWFIPSQVLNSREEGSTGVKKGKRLGFDRFNQLSCKVCRKVFHKFQSLAFHNSDEHDSRINLASPRVQHQPAAVQRTYSGPVRKSSRVSSKPVTYDDDVEILEIDVSPKKPKDMDAKKFGKLTLSAKRKIVEENNTEDEPDYTNRQSKLKKNITGVTHEITKMTNNNKKISANISGKDEEILLIELEDVDEKVDGKRLELNCSLSKPVQKKIKTAREDETKDLKNDKEILLAEDDDEDVVEKDNGKRQKPSSKLSKPAGKRLKTINNDKPNDLIEVKSSSG